MVEFVFELSGTIIERNCTVLEGLIPVQIQEIFLSCVPLSSSYVE